MADPALELVLPEAAELQEIPHGLLAPEVLPELWPSDAITVRNVLDYFKGGNIIQIQRSGYMEPLAIPKAGDGIVKAAATQAVEEGTLWLTSGPASVLGEPIPAGVLTEQSSLQRPPAMIAAAEILPENLPDAWRDDQTTAFAVATALSQKSGQTLPWKTVRDVITASLNARFTELDPTSGAWPCDYPSAQSIKLKVASASRKGKYGGGSFGGEEVREGGVLSAEAELEPSEVQDLGDVVPQLLAIKSTSGCPIVFRMRIEVGDADHTPDDATLSEINQVLANLKTGFQAS